MDPKQRTAIYCLWLTRIQAVPSSTTFEHQWRENCSTRKNSTEDAFKIRPLIFPRWSVCGASSSLGVALSTRLLALISALRQWKHMIYCHVAGIFKTGWRPQRPREGLHRKVFVENKAPSLGEGDVIEKGWKVIWFLLSCDIVLVNPRALAHPILCLKWGWGGVSQKKAGVSKRESRPESLSFLCS